MARAERPSSLTGRRERKKAAARGAVVEAAARMFVERGFEATRIDAIAEAADVSVGTVYNHFATKSDILQAVMLGDVQAVIERAAPLAAKPGGDAAAALAVLVGVLFDVLDVRPRELWRNVVGHALLDPAGSLAASYADVLLRLRDVLVLALSALHAQGDLAPRWTVEEAADVAFAIAYARFHAYVADDATKAADVKAAVRRLLEVTFPAT